MPKNNDLYFERILWQIEPEWFTKEANKRHAKYLHDLIKLIEKETKTKYSTLLDIPCGIGRLDNYLRNYSYTVTSIDNNPYFISEAKRLHKTHSKDYIKADMRYFNLRKTFDVIIYWCTSFGFYNDKENLATLKNFSNHLNKGGLLILDVSCKDWRMKHTNPKQWIVSDYDKAVKLTNTKIDKSSMIFTIKVYEKIGKNLIIRKNETSSVKLYSEKEISDMLKSAEFVIKHSFSSSTFRRHTKSDYRRILLCVKT